METRQNRFTDHNGAFVWDSSKEEKIDVYERWFAWDLYLFRIYLPVIQLLDLVSKTTINNN